MDESSPRALAERVARELATRGHRAYFVGGCVRDLLLGREPKDFDVATSAPPSELLRIFPTAQPVGAHFGVVLVREPGVHVEVATFRTDHSYRDGRRPESVAFETDPRQDALRRDFTINALMMDPESGEIHDFVDGRRDLEAGVIRAIGDPERRFDEDHLRLLRAVRFAARLGFTIHPETLRAIRVMRAKIQRVSAERVRDELVRILTEGGARRGFELLDETGLLDEVLPEIAAMKGVEQPPEFHPEGDVWIHTLLMLDALRDPSPALGLGVLLHDVGKPSTFRRAPDRIRFDGHVETGVEIARGILRRLRCSNDDAERVEELVSNHLRFKDLPKMRASTLKRFLRMEHFNEHLELHRLDCLSSHRNLANYEFARAKLAQLSAELKPPRLIDGRDLIQAGYTPGPRFGGMLAAVEDAQLDGAVRTREEALAWVRERYTDRS